MAKTSEFTRATRGLEPSEAGAARAGDSVDQDEIEKFSKQAAHWWDPTGPYKPLHKFNPARMRFIRDVVTRYFSLPTDAARPFDGLSIVDIGCGGGLVCEPLARLGARTLGVDASEENIAVARAHAQAVGLDIDYRATTAEALIEAGHAGFDVALALEIVEHVVDPHAFLQTVARLTRPGGLVIMATINRTAKAFVLAKIGAEYVLRWLPAGTHDFSKFVTPQEARDALSAAGLTRFEDTGVSYRPLQDEWRLSPDINVNYMIAARRPN